MKMVLKICSALFLTALLVGCNSNENENENEKRTECEKVTPTEANNVDLDENEAKIYQNSIYHWKTFFDLDSSDVTFLTKHNVKRIYLKMFDVAPENNLLDGQSEIVPIATTIFLTEIPENIEIVPVAYITIDALRQMAGKEQEFASLIVERLLNMASYNNCGEIREIQIDCDWTRSTRESFHYQCKCIKDILDSINIELSITIRAHQLRESPPPADRGVLMLYNTGDLKSRSTKNSILNIDDITPYLKKKKFPIPLDYAYPTFGWGVLFDGDEFKSIVDEERLEVNRSEYIRRERASIDEILEVKELVENKMGKPSRANIIYHLDQSQLENYSDEDINKIFNN